MLKRTYSNPALRHAIEIGSESEVCFATGATCLSLGVIASAAELLFPGSTPLGALWIVGCFYLLLGFLCKSGPTTLTPNRAPSSTDVSNTLAANTATTTREVEKPSTVYPAKALPQVLAGHFPVDCMSLPLQTVDRL